MLLENCPGISDGHEHYTVVRKRVRECVGVMVVIRRIYQCITFADLQHHQVPD